MRSYFIIMLFAVIFGVISNGCVKLKESQYGKFTEEEVARMPFADSNSLPDPSGGVTLSIMTETVTADDVVNSERIINKLAPVAGSGIEFFKLKARPLIEREIKDKVSKKYIYHTVKKSASSNIDEMLKKMVDREVNKHLEDYDYNDTRAKAAFAEEKDLADAGVTDWNSFREHKEMMILIRMYLSRKAGKENPVNLDDMKARYDLYIEKKHPDFVWEYKLQMRVIDIHPDKLTPDEIDSANEETKEQAALRKGKKLLNIIKKGENFGRLANENSHGIGGIEEKSGGLWAIHVLGSLAKPYDVLDKAAVKMDVSGISEVIAADGHVFIMKLEDKRVGGTTPFSEVQERMESEIKALQRQYENNKALFEIISKIEIKDMDIFTDYCLKRAFELINKKTD